MANYSNLKAAIADVIKTNGTKAITGQVLQDTLNSIVSVIGANYQFAGVATPSTNPGTPDQNVFYVAMQGGTYTNFNATALPDGISLLMWNGSWSSQVILYNDGGVFDISVYKSTGGTLATFADLAAALGTNGANVPVAARKGGMSVRFVQSSDNKYIQARCMAQNFTTDVTQWQGVDDEPTVGSDNLIKSGGVYEEISQLEKEINDYIPSVEINTTQVGWHTQEFTIGLLHGVLYHIKLRLTGFEQTQFYKVLFRNTDTRNDVTELFGGAALVTSGELIEIDYTPEYDVTTVEFRYPVSSAVAPEGNTILFVVENVISKFISIQNSIGDLDDLETTNKSSIVNAVNELHQDIGQLPTDTDIDNKIEQSLVVYNEDTSINTTQSGWHTSEIVFELNAGVCYRLDLQLTGFIQTSSYRVLFYDESHNQIDVSSIFGGGSAITSGNLINVLYTPNVNIKKVEFRYSSSGYSAPEGNTISLVSYIKSDKYALEENVRVAEDLSDVDGKLYYKGNPIATESQLSEVVTDLPVSDGSGIESGYAYIDITDRSVKVKA